MSKIEAVDKAVCEMVNGMGLATSGLSVHENLDAYRVRLRMPIFVEVLLENEVVEVCKTGDFGHIQAKLKEAAGNLYEQVTAHIEARR